MGSINADLFMETVDVNSVELYVDGSKAKQENDISYKGLCAMSLYTEGVRTVWMTDEVESGRMGVSNKVLER